MGKTQIPRYIFGSKDECKIKLLPLLTPGACGAALYVRAIQRDGCIKVNLLCYKSRVAPLKLQRIAKFELCAALVASELIARIKGDFRYQGKSCYMWSDSQIVLSWINHHPGTLPPYEAHRILKIRQLKIPDQ